MNGDEKVMEPVDLNKELGEVKRDLFELLEENNGVIDNGPMPLV